MDDSPEMREVEARTTPGHDPHMEEMAREHMPPSQEGNEREHMAPSQGGYERGPMPRSEEGHERMPRSEEGHVHEDMPTSQEGYERERRREGETTGMDGMGSGDPFYEAQARFIDDPKAAVEQARSVLERAVDRFMSSIEHEAGDGGDTERMRQAIRRYRDLYQRLGSTDR